MSTNMSPREKEIVLRFGYSTVTIFPGQIHNYHNIVVMIIIIIVLIKHSNSQELFTNISNKTEENSLSNHKL